MKVVVSVHGRYHAFDLARELHRHGALAAVVTTYPTLIARRFLPPKVRVHSAWWLEMLRRLAARCLWLSPPDHMVARSFGSFAARHLEAGADVFVGWSGASLEALMEARRLGMVRIVERGSTHIRHQALVLREEYERFGIARSPIDPRMIERELEEYAAAEAVAVPSRFAAQTFVRYGVPQEKIIVNPYGADLSRFVPLRHKAIVREPKILFVGSVGLRKGVPWLLKGFSRLKAPATLHLVGPIEAGMEALLRREPLDRVVLHGPLRSPQLERLYSESDLFCLPSIEEGFSLALLQAMAAGLPVVATPETGIEDVVAAGQEGIVVPARDSVAIGNALEQLVVDPPRRQAMGERARSSIRDGFTWADYGARAICAYGRLLTSTAPI